MSDDTHSQGANTGRGRRMGNANMRASDADREAVAALLQRHHLDGRLDFEEFQQRLEASQVAKTVGELDELVDDLPAMMRAAHTRATGLGADGRAGAGQGGWLRSHRCSWG